MVTAKFIGKIVEQPWGVSMDFDRKDQYKINQFLGFLIQNTDAIYNFLCNSFSSERAEQFRTKIEQYDEFEVLHFHNVYHLGLTKENFSDFDLKVNTKFIHLSNSDFCFHFDIPNPFLEQNLFTPEFEELDFDNLDKYKGTKLILNFDADLPPIFMTDDQIQMNQEYLDTSIDELLLLMGFDKEITKAALNDFFSKF